MIKPPREAPKQTTDEVLGHLPEFVLLALARNESADPTYRKAAVEHLIDKGFLSHAKHPDIDQIYRQVMREREAKDEVQAIVESAVEAPLDEKPVPVKGPFRASFTTKSME